MEHLDRVQQTINTLENELEVYGGLLEREARAIATYKSLYANKWMETKKYGDLKTVGDKEAFIANELEQEYLEMKVAEAKAEAQKQRTQTLRAILNGLQTLASTTKRLQDGF